MGSNFNKIEGMLVGMRGFGQPGEETLCVTGRKQSKTNRLADMFHPTLDPVRRDKKRGSVCNGDRSTNNS